MAIVIFKEIPSGLAQGIHDPASPWADCLSSMQKMEGQVTGH